MSIMNENLNKVSDAKFKEVQPQSWVCSPTSIFIKRDISWVFRKILFFFIFKICCIYQDIFFPKWSWSPKHPIHLQIFFRFGPLCHILEPMMVLKWIPTNLLNQFFELVATAPPVGWEQNYRSLVACQAPLSLEQRFAALYHTRCWTPCNGRCNHRKKKKKKEKKPLQFRLPFQAKRWRRTAVGKQKSSEVKFLVNPTATDLELTHKYQWYQKTKKSAWL